MPEPLDYRNPRRPPEPRPPAEPVQPPDVPRQVIPIEFDVRLTQTDDHPAARAIEAALRREKIACHVSDDGNRVGRLIELHVRAADQERASQIAGRIFVRRKKIKAFPRVEMPPDNPPGANRFDPGMFML